MKERIPIDTLLSNLESGSISRVGYIVDVMNAVGNMPAEEHVDYEEIKVPIMTYSEMVKDVMEKPAKSRDVLIMGLANRLYCLSYRHRFRNRERNI